MKDVVFRIGLVFWWLGATMAALGSVLFLGVLWKAVFGDVTDPGAVIGMTFVPVLITVLALWAVCFICTGSFWRRPRLPSR